MNDDPLDTDPLSESLSSLKEKPSDGKSVPWLQMATSVPLWAVITAHFASNFGSYILQTYFPSYLNEQLHYNITKASLFLHTRSKLWILSETFYRYCTDRNCTFLNITLKAGLISSIPNILKVAFTLSVGFVADFLTNRMNLPNPTVRKAMTTIGLAIPGLLPSFMISKFKTY